MTMKSLRIPRRPKVTIPSRAWEDYPVGRFGAQHGLSPSQACQAQWLFQRASARRGSVTGWRLASRTAGILSAVKGGRVGNSRWGRSMLARRGGRVMKLHAPHILQAAARKGGAVTAAQRQFAKGRRRAYFTHPPFP